MLNSVDKYRRTLDIAVTRGFTPPSYERSCSHVVYGVGAHQGTKMKRHRAVLHTLSVTVVGAFAFRCT